MARFADEKLEAFYNEFREHADKENALHDLLFREEDDAKGTPPGLCQMMARAAKDIREMKIAQDRQKTFVGGVVFTLGAVWAFVSGAGHQFFAFLSRL